MNSIFDFIRAAAPWIAIGLSAVILIVCSAAKNGKKTEGDYDTEGMCLGLCFGTAFGTMLENNTGIDISLGICIPKKSKDGEA